MFVLAALLSLLVPLATAQPIPAPSGPQLIRQRPSCLGVNAPRVPAQMLPCTTSGNVQWEATMTPGSNSYKLKNVLFGCYAVRNEISNLLVCEDEDQASVFTIEQVTGNESLILHGDQTGRVALHTIPGAEGEPVYFDPDTSEVASLFSFTPVQNQ